MINVLTVTRLSIPVCVGIWLPLPFSRGKTDFGSLQWHLDTDDLARLG